MAEACWRVAGGILGLLDLHDRHPAAIERDLIALGLRWRDVGSEAFTWGDLNAIITASLPGTAVHHVMSPDSAGWSTTNHMLADLFDAVQANTFATYRASGGKPKRPKPYPRPGKNASTRESKKFGMKPMPIPDLIARLGWGDRPEVQRGRRADAR